MGKESGSGRQFASILEDRRTAAPTPTNAPRNACTRLRSLRELPPSPFDKLRAMAGQAGVAGQRRQRPHVISQLFALVSQRLNLGLGRGIGAIACQSNHGALPDRSERHLWVCAQLTRRRFRHLTRRVRSRQFISPRPARARHGAAGVRIEQVGPLARLRHPSAASSLEARLRKHRIDCGDDCR